MSIEKKAWNVNNTNKFRSKRLTTFLPFSFVAANKAYPNLVLDLYGIENFGNNTLKELKKTNYVSFDYEKYCNNYTYVDFSNDGEITSNFAKKKTNAAIKGTTLVAWTAFNARFLINFTFP